MNDSVIATESSSVHMCSRVYNMWVSVCSLVLILLGEGRDRGEREGEKVQVYSVAHIVYMYMCTSLINWLLCSCLSITVPVNETIWNAMSMNALNTSLHTQHLYTGTLCICYMLTYTSSDMVTHQCNHCVSYYWYCLHKSVFCSHCLCSLLNWSEKHMHTILKMWLFWIQMSYRD